MDNNRNILIAYASGIGAENSDCSKGPDAILNAPEFQAVASQFDQIKIFRNASEAKKLKAINEIHNLSTQVAHITKHASFFIALGGDHTSAIGTHYGAALRVSSRGPIGLIWLDAHLDSHTPQTSETKNPHGMALASLLGYGDDRLTSIGPSLKPENVCIIGARSFENAEHEFLKRINVKIFYMQDVLERGFNSVFQDALAIAQNGTAGFGISFDLDMLDPQDAPGTGVKEPNGVRWADVLPEFKKLRDNKNFLGMDITEFNPQLDHHDHRTQMVVIDTIKSII